MTDQLPWGPTVVQITTGPRGVQGPRGTRWTIGSGSPPPLPPGGRVGDIWLDLDTGNVHQATSLTAWELRGSIRGPEGLAALVTFADLNGAISTLENSLGTAALVNTGTASGEVPTNADLSATNTSYDDTVTDFGLVGADQNVQKAIEAVFAQASSGVTLTAIRVYETAGSPHTWPKPEGLDFCIVKCWSGGGGSAGGYGASGASGSGGGGAYGIKRIDAGDLSSTETVTVGDGGDGATAGANDATAGGASSFGPHLSCTGGNPGQYTGGNGAPGGAGGVATGGDVGISGGKGYDGNSTSGTAFGVGGDAPLGAQGAVKSHAAAGNGVAGSVPGSGAASGSGNSGAGARGGAGRIEVYEFVRV